jgi:cytochrome b subunit of formate dehydrogenase
MFSKYSEKPVLIICALFFLAFSSNLFAQEFKCADCHETSIAKSVHKDALDCQACHQDVKDEKHIEKKPAKVKCESCHEEYGKSVKNDIHHRLITKVKNPPDCKTCHGTHEIAKPPKENTLKVKEYCSKCHQNMVMANPYHAQTTGSNACVKCHTEADHKPELKSSVHKNLECSDCHNYIANNLAKHPQNMKGTQKADCYLCHSNIAKEHRESIHGISLSEGIDEAAMCWNCHGSHNIKKVKDPQSMVYPSNIAATCGNCHDNPKIMEKFDLGIKNPEQNYLNSIHGQLVTSGRKDAPTCTVCHGVHDIKNKIQPGSKISTFNTPLLCGSCHKDAAKDYQESIHWLRAKKGYKESPVCDDCHSEHSIRQINTGDKRAESKKIQEETCVICHQSKRIAARFGSEGGQALLYQDSYHGLAVMRGDKKAAMCVDCHSTHKILPKSYEESSVNINNVTATCKKCHPNASTVFSQSYSHKTQNAQAAKIENLVGDIYFWMIISVIGAMILHNTLIFIYEVRKKRKKMLNDITIPRFTKNEVIQHYLLLSSFLTLAITGFALKYNQSWWAEMLQSLGMSELARQYIHRTAAVILITTGIYHIFYLFFTNRGRDVLQSLVPKFNDVLDARDNILYYLKLKKNPPKFGNYDYAEKAEYWALIWGTVVMGATGFLLWFPTIVGNWAPIWLIKVGEMIHFYEAVLATLAIVVWHWFFVIFHPAEYPMSVTWIDGKMSLKTYRHHHENHFRKIALEWMEYQNGLREHKKLSSTTLLFTSAFEKKGLDPDLIIRREIDSDLELSSWITEKLTPKKEEDKEIG